MVQFRSYIFTMLEFIRVTATLIGVYIWQDVYEDTSSSLTTLLFGIGYSETIPAMNISDRSGIDGLNENVHNSFVNIFARGGLFQLFYSYFYEL